MSLAAALPAPTPRAFVDRLDAGYRFNARRRRC
jgi:hypothetical protein